LARIFSVRFAIRELGEETEMDLSKR